jgi:hypothetical protein
MGSPVEKVDCGSEQRKLAPQLGLEVGVDAALVVDDEPFLVGPS